VNAGIWFVNISGRLGTGCPGRVGGCEGWRGCAGRTAKGGAKFGIAVAGDNATGPAGSGCDWASCIRRYVGGSGFAVCPETFKATNKLTIAKQSSDSILLFRINCPDFVLSGLIRLG